MSPVGPRPVGPRPAGPRHERHHREERSGAGPIPDRTIEAVAACTRALAERDDADARLAWADAATLGGLRAFADRLALRARHHDSHIHLAHQPRHPRAADIYAWLEDARLDSLGARRLRGVAQNLLAHPGADADGPRWLAFEVFSDRAAPREKAALVAASRGCLPRSLVDRLAALADTTNTHTAFAPASAAWAELAAPHLAAGGTSTAPGPSVALSLRQVVERKRRPGGDTSRTSARDPRTAAHAHPQAGSDTDTAPGNPGHAEIGSETYCAFTTAHDRVVNAASLASRAELAELRLKLAAELSQVRSVVGRLAKRLLRVLMARQVREWRFDLEEGVIDGSRLAMLVASRGGARPFKLEGESRFPDTVVSLLIDHSGSMRGRPMLIAALTVEIFARVLERCGVRCEVLGFTTRDWDGGEPWKEWASQGFPERPGRLNALEHIIIKSADAPWRRARVGLGLFLHDEMLKENIDGEALAWAHGRLLSRPEARRILVVVSDGTPMDEATLAANDHEYLDLHLRAVIQDIETRSPVQLAAIGIGHDVSAFYGNATTIARVDQLGPALGAKLMALLDPDATAPRPAGPGRRRQRAHGPVSSY